MVSIAVFEAANSIDPTYEPYLGFVPVTHPADQTVAIAVAAHHVLVHIYPARQPIFAGRFGNAGYGTITGPGLVTFDFGAFKEFSFTERVRLRFQAQIKNLPNHPNWGNPDANLTSGNYGRITALSAINTGLREVVLGVRLLF